MEYIKTEVFKKGIKKYGEVHMKNQRWSWQRKITQEIIDDFIFAIDYLTDEAICDGCVYADEDFNS